MSPASGNASPVPWIYTYFCVSFHSINVPSEWEHICSKTNPRNSYRVSIQLMSPASGNYLEIDTIQQILDFLACFHSINVPSEWEPDKTYLPWIVSNVSIQLMSPASGNHIRLVLTDFLYSKRLCVSIQLMSPASGNSGFISTWLPPHGGFPFN